MPVLLRLEPGGVEVLADDVKVQGVQGGQRVVPKPDLRGRPPGACCCQIALELVADASRLVVEDDEPVCMRVGW